MPTKLINCKLDVPLSAGKSKELWWNNAKPRNSVYGVQAVPLATGDSSKGFKEDASLEVVRVWRRLIVTENKSSPQSQIANVVLEDEVHYIVKNVGKKTSRFNVFISVVY